MKREEFTYIPRVNPTGDITQRVRTVQFGDGYSQRSGDGINSNHQSWPLTFVGNQQYIGEIRQFLLRHQGWRSFKWRNPLSELGLYACQGHRVTALGMNGMHEQMYQLTATFETTYQP
ncbi:phage tail protein [Xenorhabdus bovienii]|uniref:phage tail protein n=1 Tax=Xenorhabdus bovienii TaxID=40576 RepID=UPI0023B23905|nr:phage tail protein [Xenorhabdus bovienii]MDE9430661.1 phage tail protein [Xenorhabdus bovienii]MDE9463421.1 phage tail protein [Xenorhabdus bovienii]MDE9471111.1 phage tail protein [Xenorhabdus bovienii]MDE9557632.1 phage tail protein [Xenorhabdus bovienii]